MASSVGATSLKLQAEKNGTSSVGATSKAGTIFYFAPSGAGCLLCWRYYKDFAPTELAVVPVSFHKSHKSCPSGQSPAREPRREIPIVPSLIHPFVTRPRLC